MMPDALDHELSREPFVPLRVFLDDGRTIIIRNPGLCYINRGSVYIARVDRPNSRLAADVEFISLRHIVSVEQIEPESPGTGSHQSAA